MFTNKKTLLLSQGYQLIKRIDPKKAICMYFLDKVDIVEEYPDFISSPSVKVHLPAVVRLKHYTKTEPLKVRFSRKNIYARDKKVCQYCGENFKPEFLTLDHVIPKSFGGQTSWTNIVSCCKPCNTKKADRTPQQAKMRLLSMPKYPNVKMVYAETLNGEIPEEWKNWLF